MAHTGGHIGFIGIGRMGLPMAGHVQGAGYDVVAYDIASAAKMSSSLLALYRRTALTSKLSISTTSLRAAALAYT